MLNVTNPVICGSLCNRLRFGTLPGRAKKLLLIMNFAAVFLLTASLTASAAGWGQKISLNESDAPLTQVFSAIKKQTGYTFAYAEPVLKDAKRVTVKISNATIDEVLKLCFNGQPLTYTIIEKTVVVKAKPDEKNDNTSLNLFIPPNDVRGRITNEAGEPVEASVIVKGTQQGTTTNADGYFELKDVDDNATLVISGVSIQSLEVKVNGRSELKLKVKIKESLLDQVQIIAYGTTTKRLNTGNVATIKSNTLSQQPITNLLQGIQGRITGVQIIQSSGLPGANFSVQIRGRNSIAASNNPLYIVDGVPFTSTSVGRFSSLDIGSPLNSISPNDIESIDILKDADATAIYGSRGANGVVLITTKKGKRGKTNLDFNLNSGIGSVSRIAQTLSTEQYLQVRKDAFLNSNLTPTVSNAPDLMSGWDQTNSIDWQKWYMGRTAKNTDVSLSVSGGDGQTSFLLSGGYRRESTVMSTDDGYGRSNVHLNVNHSSENKQFSLGANLFYTSDKNVNHSFSSDNLLGVAWTIPFYPIYTASRAYNWPAGLTNYKAQFEAYKKVRTDNLNSSINLTYKISDELFISSSAGFNRIAVDQINPYPSTAKDPATNPTGSSTFGNQSLSTYLFEPQVTYKKDVLAGTLNVLAGATIQKNFTNGRSISVSNYTSDLLLENPGFGTPTASGSTIDYRYLSFFGRLNYNWHNRYLINATLRRDGSSRFGSDRQFGNFGSIGAAWLFSNEQLIKNNFQWMSFGKARASYGTTGNDGIPDYGYLSAYSSSANYAGTPAITSSQLANPNFGWEINKKLEFGLELGFLHDRIFLASSYYRNRSGNQLVGYPLPSMTGFTTYQANLPAVVQNSGLEIELNTTNIRNENFKWETSFNATIPRNKLVAFPNIEATSYANTLVVGQPLNIIQAYHFIGVDPQTGLAVTQDINKDNIYTFKSSYNNQGGDLIIAGTTDPRWYGGLNNHISFKGFQLNIFLQYTRQQGYNLKASSSLFGRQYNTWAGFLNYWKIPGDLVEIPKPLAAFNNDQSRFSQSDAIISDASFLRVKNISLSYDFPATWIKGAGLRKLNVYTQAQNLWTVTNYLGYDPEMAASSSLQIPTLRTIVFGLKCSF